MSKTAWIIFSVFTVGILAILVIFSTNSKIDISKVDINKVQTASGQNGNIADNVTGKKDSKVILIEYGDYQCGGCAAASPVAKEVASKYSNEIAFVFRNYLIPGHTNARAAAAAAESAGLQGKYWEMHDRLYSEQLSWSGLNETDRQKYFDDLARQLKLNQSKFDQDMMSTSVEDKINFDIAMARKAGLNSTPTFYLNGSGFDEKSTNQIINGEKSILTDRIDSELKKYNIALPK
ncbi:MAG: DsbA family protein [Thiobacillus sp.]